MGPLPVSRRLSEVRFVRILMVPIRIIKFRNFLKNFIHWRKSIPRKDWTTSFVLRFHCFYSWPIRFVNACESRTEFSRGEGGPRKNFLTLEDVFGLRYRAVLQRRLPDNGLAASQNRLQEDQGREEGERGGGREGDSAGQWQWLDRHGVYHGRSEDAAYSAAAI